MKRREVIAPFKVRLSHRTDFGYHLCFAWGKRTAYIGNKERLRIQRFRRMPKQIRVGHRDNYVFVFQDKFCTPLKPLLIINFPSHAP